MSKLIFLGAGASKDAGYPLTCDLYNELKNESLKTPFLNFKSAWNAFDENLDIVKESCQGFKNCKDLEYLITVMSLLEGFHMTRSGMGIDVLQDKAKMASALESDRIAEAYKHAKSKFGECIEWLLAYKNFDMKDNEYAYLRNFFKSILSSGDTVITTNYDLLAERALGELDLWHIRDGYGFEIKLEKNFNYSVHDLSDFPAAQKERIRELIAKDKNVVSKYNAKISPTKVLKLHGSVGWLKNGEDIVADTTSLHYVLPDLLQGYQDKKYDPSLYDDKYLILPSFIKNYQHKIILQVWAQAAQACQDAKEIHIIGSSFPEYDTNIKTLLLPLYNNLIAKKSVVKVYLMKADRGAKKRWRRYFGNAAEYIEVGSFKEYVASLSL